MNSKFIKTFVSEIEKEMENEKDFLITEDSKMGDGDLGLTMSEGFREACRAIEKVDEEDCGKLLYIAGKAMGNKVPSTMGTLMASGLIEAGKSLKDVYELSKYDLILLLSSYLVGVERIGKAQAGEKTFIDGFAPAIETMEKTQDLPFEESIEAALDSSRKGYFDTKNMKAIHGRAALRGEKSKTTCDPGAYVGYLIIKAFYISYITLSKGAQ